MWRTPCDCAQTLNPRLVNSGPLSGRTACGYPRKSAALYRTWVTYWPEIPKSTAIPNLSWLKSSASLRYFRRRPPERLAVAHKIHAPDLVDRACQLQRHPFVDRALAFFSMAQMRDPHDLVVQILRGLVGRWWISATVAGTPSKLGAASEQPCVMMNRAPPPVPATS